MASTFYIPYLVAFAALPVLARWRWGLVAALVVTVVELGPSSPSSMRCTSITCCPCLGQPPPKEPMEPIIRRQGAGYAQAYEWVVIPGHCARSAAATARRELANGG